MSELKSIAVFCGSCEGNDTLIISQAIQLGKTLAKQNITLTILNFTINTISQSLVYNDHSSFTHPPTCRY